MQVFTVVTPHILYHKNIINGDKNVRGLQKSTKCNAKDRGIMEQKAPLKKDNLKLSNEESNRITKESLTIALIRLMAKRILKGLPLRSWSSVPVFQGQPFTAIIQVKRILFGS